MRRAALTLALILGLVTSPAAQEPTDVGRGIRQALKHGRTGDHDAAIRIYRGLLIAYPKRADLAQRLADTLGRAGRYEEALDVLDGRIAHAPDDTKALIRRAIVLISLGRRREAKAAVDIVLARSTLPAHFASTAETCRKRGLDDLAAHAYRYGRKALGDPTLFQRELADIALAQGDHLTALTEFVSFASERPQYVPLVESRFRDIASDAPDPQPVFGLLLHDLRQGPTAQRARWLVVFAQAAGLERNALDALVELPSGSPVQGSLLFLGTDALDNDAFDLAAQAFDALFDRANNKALRLQAKLGYARALEGAGVVADAEQAYRSLLDNERTNRISDEASYRLSSLLRSRGASEAARTLLEASLLHGHHHRFRSLALFELADLHVESERYAQAESVLETVHREQQGKDNAFEAIYRHAEIAVLQGKFEKAQSLLKKVLEGGTRRSAFNDALDLSRILTVGTQDDDAGLAVYAEAWRLERSGRFEEALTSLSDAPQGRLDDVNLKRQVDLNLRLGHHRAALGVCDHIVRRYPWSPFAPWALVKTGDLHRDALGELEQAAAAYERVLIEYPTSIQAERARVNLKGLRPDERAGAPREPG